MLFLAATMIFATVGLSMDMHFCNGQLKNVNLLGDAQNCHDAVKTTSHCAKMQMDSQLESCTQPGVKSDNCCDNKTISVELEEDFVQSSINSVSFEQSAIILAYALTLLDVQSNALEIIPYQNYKPPLLDREIPLLLQSFLC